MKTVRKTHGMSGTKEHCAWNHIRRRCSPKAIGRDRRDYFERGIYVSKRWLSFDNFLSDMGQCPSSRHSIGRIDNNGPYAFWNCRWETPEQQGNNTRRNKFMTLGTKTQTQSQWARELGLSPEAIIMRLKRGWTLANTLSIPLQTR